MLPSPAAVLASAVVVLVAGVTALAIRVDADLTAPPAAATIQVLEVAPAVPAAPPPRLVEITRVSRDQPLPMASPPPTEEPEPADERRGLLPPVDTEVVHALAQRTGIPKRALEAYAGAYLRMQEERPACNLDWTLLAAIGYVESGHGTHGGGRIDGDGDATHPITGPVLDGSRGVRAITDTDGGRLDGDARWDRAVGPMQFIPQTWERWGTDANGDGVADPHNIDDAALSAARYLCAGGGDLGTGGSWGRAVLSYNNSDDYVRHVLHINNWYARASHGS